MSLNYCFVRSLGGDMHSDKRLLVFTRDSIYSAIARTSYRNSGCGL